MSNTSGGDFNETAVPESTSPRKRRPEGDSAEGVSAEGVSTEGGSSARSGVSSTTGQKKKKKIVQLGDFRLVKKLGQGGMGEVYLAKQISLDRLVALKVLSKELAKKKGFVERFVREARAMARIDHPHAVKVYAAEADKGLNFVAIEYIDGQSMQDVLDSTKQLSVGDAIHVTIACADALAHAHDMNLIHRDIKPDNILVTKKGVVKVADFGLAKALDDEDMSMTQSGTGLGTPLYMPPEQARDAKHVDQRTDIYALGCTLYYFLAGKLPFEGESVLKLILAKEKGQYESIRKLNPNVSERLELMIDKMIQKDPNHRYSSCADVIADLESLGVESELLSFAETDGAAPARSARTRSRVTVAGGTTATTASSFTAQHRTSAEDAMRSEAAESGTREMETWLVRYKDRNSNVQIKAMTTRQIQQGILSQVLGPKTQAKNKNLGGGFLPLAAYAEFEDLVNKGLQKASENARADSMKDMYAKIDREDRRRRRWRWLKNLTENVLGGFSLVVYLVVVAVVLGAAVWFVIKVAYPRLNQYVEDDSTEASEPAEVERALDR
ncbi:MAG: serine/threonine protein kinase [Planctomycetota bacterium]|jgi:serine/threonine-protein kinase